MVKRPLPPRPVQLPKIWLTIPAGQAAVTQLWLDGVSQRDIANAFGYTASRICLAINQFTTDYYGLPNGYDCTKIEWRWLAAREMERATGKFVPPGQYSKNIAKKAINRYLSTRREHRPLTGWLHTFN